jgi:hypothetical protein
MTELACAVCDRRRDGDHQLERPEMTSSGERHWLRPVATAGSIRLHPSLSSMTTPHWSASGSQPADTSHSPRHDPRYRTRSLGCATDLAHPGLEACSGWQRRMTADD